MPYENKIIDFLSGQVFKLGFVLREQRDKLQIEDENGRNARVALKQIAIVHSTVSGGLSSAANIKKVLQEIEKTLEEIDTTLLWEALQENQKSEYALAEMAEEYFGDSNPIAESALARALKADSLHFKQRSLSFSTRSAEDVQALQHQQQREHERAELREKAFAFVRKVLQDQNPPVEVPPDLEAFVTQTEEFILLGNNTAAVELLEDLFAKQDARETGVNLLQQVGRLPADTDPFLLKHGIFPAFTRAVEEESAALHPYKPDPERMDCSSLITFSIDDHDTREVDDAISVEKEADSNNWIIYIHIADPATFIHKQDAVDRAAFERSLTLYLPTETVTMLPNRIGCDLGTLKPEELRPSLSFTIRVDANGSILDWTFARAQVRLDKRLDYEEVDEILTGKQLDPLAEKLSFLLSFAEKLQQHRQENGAVSLLKPEMKVRVQGDLIKVTRLPAQSPSRLLVSELMILANRLTAEYALRHDVPVIYRTQPPPKQAVSAMQDYDPVTFIREVRKMSKTRLSTHPEFHSGLGVDLYTQVSSPLRRYTDLVVLRQLAAQFANEPFPYTVTELLQVLTGAEETASRNRQLEQKATEYWLLEYLQRHHLQDALAATVLSAGQGFSNVELNDFLLRGQLKTTTKLQAGDAVSVQIDRIQPEEGKLILKQM